MYFIVTVVDDMSDEIYLNNYITSELVDDIGSATAFDSVVQAKQAIKDNVETLKAYGDIAYVDELVLTVIDSVDL